MKRIAFILAMAVGFFGALVPRADAVLIDFNFNSLLDGASNLAVQNYMRNILNVQHPGGSVAVLGSQAERDYIGDGYVVGPVAGSVGDRRVIPLTLGYTDGNIAHGLPLDTFIVNSELDRIVMQFDFPIYSVSFDYEIFPDGTCPEPGPSCGPTSANWPDFTFRADDEFQFRTLGINPAVSGPYQHSPESGLILNERAPQYLGVSGEFLFPNGVSGLAFIDWPRMIGIDNLRIYDQPSMPEPASIFLLASGLIGFAGFGRRKGS